VYAIGFVRVCIKQAYEKSPTNLSEDAMYKRHVVFAAMTVLSGAPAQSALADDDPMPAQPAPSAQKSNPPASHTGQAPSVRSRLALTVAVLMSMPTLAQTPSEHESHHPAAPADSAAMQSTTPESTSALLLEQNDEWQLQRRYMVVGRRQLSTSPT